MDGPYLVYLLSIDGHLSCFHFLASVNNAAKNMSIQISVSAFNSFVYKPRSRIAGSNRNSIFNF